MPGDVSARLHKAPQCGFATMFRLHEAAWCGLNSWYVTPDCTSGRGSQVIWFIATLARFAEFYPPQKRTHVWELYTSELDLNMDLIWICVSREKRERDWVLGEWRSLMVFNRPVSSLCIVGSGPSSVPAGVFLKIEKSEIKRSEILHTSET